MKIVCAAIRDEGHKVVLVAREKDVLFQLLDGEDFLVGKIISKEKQGEDRDDH